MPVAVVGADADESDSRSDRRVEAGRLVGRTVVGDLDDVDSSGAGSGEHPLLGGFPEVTEEESAEALGAASSPDEEGEAPVVPGHGLGRRGPEQLPRQAAESPLGAPPWKVHVGAAGDEPRRDVGIPFVLGSTEECLVDAPVELLHSPHVIQVVVGEHEEVESVDAETVQAVAEQFRIGTGVDERDRSGIADEQRIPLPDVAQGVLPVPRPSELVRRPAAEEGQRVEDEGEREQDRRPAAETRPHRGKHEEGDPESEECEEDHPDRAVRPGPAGERKSGEEVRDVGDPARGDPGD